jgi:hypothetical protein
MSSLLACGADSALVNNTSKKIIPKKKKIHSFKEAKETPTMGRRKASRVLLLIRLSTVYAFSAGKEESPWFFTGTVLIFLLRG